MDNNTFFGYLYVFNGIMKLCGKKWKWFCLVTSTFLSCFSQLRLKWYRKNNKSMSMTKTRFSWSTHNFTWGMTISNKKHTHTHTNKWPTITIYSKRISMNGMKSVTLFPIPLLFFPHASTSEANIKFSRKLFELDYYQCDFSPKNSFYFLLTSASSPFAIYFPLTILIPIKPPHSDNIFFGQSFKFSVPLIKIDRKLNILYWTKMNNE